MKWIISAPTALIMAALVACNAQPSARKPAAQLPVAQAPASIRASAKAPLLAKASATAMGSIGQDDSLHAFLGVRPMQFRYVADSLRQGTPTVAGRYIVIHELFQTPRILYRSTTDSTRWFQFKLEPVGESGTVGGDFTVDTVRLDPQRQTLLLKLQGQNGFWGGSLAYGQTAIVDVTAEPVLLLKTEVLREDVSYGREDDTVYNEDAAGSESLSQEISIRNHRLMVGPPRQTTRRGLRAKQVTSIMRPTPKSVLPAGSYRYWHGKLLLVGK